jgi:hypothetical protein
MGRHIPEGCLAGMVTAQFDSPWWGASSARIISPDEIGAGR